MKPWKRLRAAKGDLIERLARRKVERFASNPRIVIDVKAFREGDRVRILAASAV